MNDASGVSIQLAHTTAFIRLDDLRGAAIAQLLQEHLHDMHAQSPPGSVHALDLEALRTPAIRFWTLWSAAGELLGCAALKQLSATHAELKSMRTARDQRGRGVGRALLEYVVDVARASGLSRISLETGATEGFAPARRMYAGFGFEECAPFADYRLDPHSVFMTLELRSRDLPPSA